MRLRLIEAEFGERIELLEKFFPLRPGLQEKAEFTEYIVSHRRAASDQMRGDPELKNPPAFSIPPLGAAYPRSSMPALEAAAFVRKKEPERFRDFDLAVFEAFFVRTEDISNINVLVRLASGLGIDEPVLRKALAGREYRDEVLNEFRVATEEFGVSGIPTVILPGQFPIVGAVPAAQYREAVSRMLRLQAAQ